MNRLDDNKKSADLNNIGILKSMHKDYQGAIADCKY
jgi:hypothetical protein